LGDFFEGPVSVETLADMRCLPSFLALASVCALTSLFPSPAAAEEPRELSVLVDPSLPCVHFDELLAALRRDLPFQVLATPKSASRPTHEPDLQLHLDPTPGEKAGVAVHLSGARVHLDEIVHAATCETTTQVVAAFVTSALSAPPHVPHAAAAPPHGAPPPDSTIAQRATLLDEVLATHDRLSPAGIRTIGGGLAVSGAGFIGLGIYNLADHQPTLGWALIGFGAPYAVSGALLFLHPDETPLTGVYSATLLGGAAVFGAFDLGADPAVPPVGIAAVVAGNVAEAGLLITRDLVRPPLTLRRIRAIHASIATPAQRSALAAADLQAFEDEVERSRSPLSPWVMVLPIALGGGVALASALDTRYAERPRIAVAVQGLVMLLNAVAIGDTLERAPDRMYQEKLELTGLQLSMHPLPGGAALSVSGRF
jgi:hypothetical protein